MLDTVAKWVRKGPEGSTKEYDAEVGFTTSCTPELEGARSFRYLETFLKSS